MEERKKGVWRQSAIVPEILGLCGKGGVSIFRGPLVWKRGPEGAGNCWKREKCGGSLAYLSTSLFYGASKKRKGVLFDLLIGRPDSREESRKGGREGKGVRSISGKSVPDIV